MLQKSDILYRQKGLFTKAVGNPYGAYVGKLCNKFGDFRHSLVLEDFDGVEVTTSTGEDHARALGYASYKFVGIACEAAAVYNKQTVEIYKFIKSIEVSHSRFHSYANFSDIFWEYSPKSNIVDNKSSAMFILLGDMDFRGECGSVITWYRAAAGMRWSAYSLTDFLLYLSKVFDVDIFAYDTIRFACRPAGVISGDIAVPNWTPVTSIKLVHTDASERYFIKLRMLGETQS